jgi:Fur family ferric uptake transcriptional regulator
MTKPDRASWENFSDYLISQGLRMTGQRKAVFDALFRQTGHFTADQLLQDARENG